MNLLLAAVIFFIVAWASRFMAVELSQVIAAVDESELGSSHPHTLRIKEFQFLHSEICRLIARVKQTTELETIALVATQVSHDIRSPLSAINMIVGNTPEVSSENRNLLDAATKRINDIANDLLKRYKTLPSPITAPPKSSTITVTTSKTDLFNLVGQIYLEKVSLVSRHPDVAIELEATPETSDFSVVGTSPEIGRVLSNLLNNAIEAVNQSGRIQVSIRSYKNEAAVIISDNGPGIPEEVMSRIGEQGFSHGKDLGHGLGIFSAKQLLESWGGKLILQSREGIGTQVTVLLSKIY